MEQTNQHFVADILTVLPDGDAELPDDAYAEFIPVPCDDCGGIIKPNVVFFGENVPRERVDQAMVSVASSDALLVIGSSLHVWSGYRFAIRAHELGKPVLIINQGETRADHLATIKLEANCGDVMEALAAGQKQ